MTNRVTRKHRLVRDGEEIKGGQRGLIMRCTKCKKYQVFTPEFMHALVTGKADLNHIAFGGWTRCKGTK